MTTDSYKDYMYYASKRREKLEREIKSLSREIEGIDFFLIRADLSKGETTVFVKKRDVLFHRMEGLMDELNRL